MVKEKKLSTLLTTVCLLIGLGFSLDMTSKPAMGAQLGGFLKKKIKDVVKPEPEKGNQTDTDSSSGNDSNSRFNDRVLELNEDVLAKLEKTLLCEKDFRAAVDAKYAKMPTEEQYQKCSIDAMMSQEAQAIASKPGDNIQAQQQQMTSLAALIEKKCGKNPNTFSKSDELKPAAEKCSATGGLTLSQYSIAKERVTPFCGSGGQNKVTGIGNNYYVYTPAEVDAMKPKCAKLTSLMK
jgi:hypothetical protein